MGSLGRTPIKSQKELRGINVILSYCIPAITSVTIVFAMGTLYTQYLYQDANLMHRIPRWKLKHCSREANACADQLARMALHLQQPFVLLDTPPVEVSSLLLYDLSGLGCNRICANTSPWAM
ncbi:hypothetical protein SO802_015445 [Lithocarpus litseifolius]|uniref:RNase H type-1 domain-containing protein n=1 Tax=Lithocarpus litseifolius TaxID=425828 RepID=A0AAW2CUC3_9ROSI